MPISSLLTFRYKAAEIIDILARHAIFHSYPESVSLRDVGKAMARLAQNSAEFEDEESLITLIETGLSFSGFEQNGPCANEVRVDLRMVAKVGEDGCFPELPFSDFAKSVGYVIRRSPEWTNDEGGIAQITAGMREYFGRGDDSA